MSSTLVVGSQIFASLKPRKLPRLIVNLGRFIIILKIPSVTQKLRVAYCDFFTSKIDSFGSNG